MMALATVFTTREETPFAGYGPRRLQRRNAALVRLSCRAFTSLLRGILMTTLRKGNDETSLGHTGTASMMRNRYIRSIE